jgi:hypothetical protein
VEPDKGSKAETRESRPPTPGDNHARQETAEEETARQAAQQPQGDDTAIFRFSTEGFIPSWLPIPSFSFEVVRRQHPADIDEQQVTRGAEMNETDAQPDFAAPGEHANDSGTLLRRLFGFAFGPPMTPEEEDAALEQLMEMFPQYERDDLLRELRARGSIEHVAESILLGFFSGTPRNDL